MLLILGENSTDLYIFITGSLEILDVTGSMIDKIAPFDLVGDIDFFHDSPRTASVRCVGDQCSFLWKLSREDYDKITYQRQIYVDKIGFNTVRAGGESQPMTSRQNALDRHIFDLFKEVFKGDKQTDVLTK